MDDTGTFVCPVCGQDFPHTTLDPVHVAAAKAAKAARRAERHAAMLEKLPSER